jgi:Na+/proline symporter
MTNTEQVPQVPQAPQVQQGTDGKAIASLVLSIVWVWGLGSLLAVIFAAVSFSDSRKAGQPKQGMAVAGMVIGIVGLAGAALVTLLWIVAASSCPSYGCS